jgi:ubiquitin C-terminal hydrolase
MPDLIGPGLLNRSHLCYINAFVQTLFHILPLRLMILAWPNDNPIGTEFRLLFAQMSRHEVTSAASLSRICELHLVCGQDCSEFGMQIFQALHNSFSEGLRYTVENLICFQLSMRFRGPFSQENVTQTQEFFFRLPIADSSTLIDCLNSFFAAIPYSSQEYETRQYSISFFPRFLFINLGRDMWNGMNMEKDCRRIDCPAILDLSRSAFHEGICPRYQLATVISHLGRPPQDVGHCMAFLKISRQWMRFNDTEVEAINQSAALEGNFPENDRSTQTATILLYASDQ